MMALQLLRVSIDLRLYFPTFHLAFSSFPLYTKLAFTLPPYFFPLPPLCRAGLAGALFGRIASSLISLFLPCPFLLLVHNDQPARCLVWPGSPQRRNAVCFICQESIAGRMGRSSHWCPSAAFLSFSPLANLRGETEGIGAASRP